MEGLYITCIINWQARGGMSGLCLCLLLGVCNFFMFNPILLVKVKILILISPWSSHNSWFIFFILFFWKQSLWSFYVRAKKSVGGKEMQVEKSIHIYALVWFKSIIVKCLGELWGTRTLTCPRDYHDVGPSVKFNPAS